jgi:glutaredoxin
MSKKFIFIFLFFCLIGLTLAGCSRGNNGGGTEAGLILYTSDSCPHCANVEEFMAENKVIEKLNLVRKEVSKNQSNAVELLSRAQACGLPSNNVGVPFLWHDGQCLLGDEDIINFFKTKL